MPRFCGVCANYTLLSSPSQDLPNQNKLHATPQKDLTNRSTARIIGARPILRSKIDFALAQRDLPNLKKFCPHPQKRLDIGRFCTYFGARNTFGFAHRFPTGAPAPKSRCQAIWLRWGRGVFHVEQSGGGASLAYPERISQATPNNKAMSAETE